jgi:Uma2 family endonuclease
MATKPRILLRIEYEEAAEAYLRSLPPEHFMEGVPQATQRKITLHSMDQVNAYRSDVQVFNELLIQYPYGDPPVIRQVVPDNMVVVSDEPIKANGSFDVPFQKVGAFWVMEYVSKHNKRRDYDESFPKYERELKVPYLLLFYPDNQEMTLYHHSGKKYVSVKPNENGRYPIPKLDIEIALLDGWVRYWYKGKLLPLPAELLRELDEVRRQLVQAKRLASREKRRADEEARRAQELHQRADNEARRAQELHQRADNEARRAQELHQRADNAESARRAAEQEVAQLRAQLEKLRTKPANGK